MILCRVLFMQEQWTMFFPAVPQRGDVITNGKISDSAADDYEVTTVHWFYEDGEPWPNMPPTMTPYVSVRKMS